MAEGALLALQDLDFLDDVNQVLRPERVYRDHSNPFEYYSDDEFRKRFRFTKEGTMFILNLISEELEHGTNRGHGLPPMLQLLVTLRYYATGSFQMTVGDLANIHQSTVSRTVKHVSNKLAAKKPDFIKFPASPAERQSTSQKFWGIATFPGVVGAIDCSHIRIKNPGGEDSQRYINRKGWHSLNCQYVGNANLKITNIVARWHGSVHDSRIFHESQLKQKFERNEYKGILLGDSGYPCLSYLMTPVLHPTTAPQRAYNESQIQTRNTIERLFGVLKRRFPCLHFGLRVHLQTSMSVIVATAVLHNIARDLQEQDFDDNDNEDQEVRDHFVPAQENIRGNLARARLIDEYFT